MLPVTAGPAIPHCPPRTPVHIDGREVDYWEATAGYTFPFNLTGHPVVVLPLARSGEGLPIGVQVVGRRWGEMDLLALASALVGVTGPFQPPSALRTEDCLRLASPVNV